MNNKTEHIADLLPDLMTRGLEPEEEARVVRHLAHCAECRAERAALQDAFDSIGMLAQPHIPAVDLRQRVLAGLPRRITAFPRAARALARYPKITFAASFVLVAALVASVLLNVNHIHARATESGLVRLETTNRILTVLHGTEVAPTAHGVIVEAGPEAGGLLLAFGLPIPPEGHAYQLWLVRDNVHTNGGIIEVNARGHVVHRIETAQPLSQFPSFKITVEPINGSDFPTGDRIMDGDLESVNM